MPTFKDKWYVPEELIEELRTLFINEINSSQVEAKKYHPEDIQRVKDNDFFIARYILHQEQKIPEALQMLKDSLKYRNDMEINTITKQDLPADYFHVRAVILYNQDNRDHPLVVIRAKTYIKNPDTRRLQQQYLYYWVERGVRASNWGAVSILFDCTDAGVSNLDVEMIRFIMNLFKRFCPWGLGYFIVYNMPWYMNAFWKMIKTFIPQQHVERVCFVDSKTIREYIDEDQLPPCIGGTSTKLYEPKEGIEDDIEEENELPSLIATC